DDGQLRHPERLLHLLRHHHVAGHEVLVGVAQPRSRELEQHLAGLGRVELDLLDAPLRVRFPEDGGLALHGPTLLPRYQGRDWPPLTRQMLPFAHRAAGDARYRMRYAWSMASP